MPAKNAIKEYEAGGYYHIYNRGVDKRSIFEDDKDYKTFLSYLKFYLTPFDELDLQGSSLQVKMSPSKIPKNYFGEITLLAYCLMPNHFHLMVRQNTDHGIDSFMRSVSTKYVRYFNTRYRRVGPLFQGIYKAVKISNEYQFVYLTKYIHRNPVEMFACKDNPCRLEEYKFSSYPNDLKQYFQTWVNTTDILSLFSNSNPRSTYQSFVENGEVDDVTVIAPVAIDLD